MMNYRTEIAKALFERLLLLPSRPPIEHENTDYKPVEGTTYLQAFDIPITQDSAGVGVDSLIRCDGIFQINVKGPSGVGSIKNKTLADKIASWFKRGTTLTSPGGQDVKILRSEVNGGFNEEDWYTIPVSVYYYGYAQNT